MRLSSVSALILVSSFLMTGCGGAPPAGGPDLSSPSGFLAAFQAHAANGDVDAMSALVGHARSGSLLEEYAFPLVVRGGEFHRYLMSLTPRDLSPEGGSGQYGFFLYSEDGVDEEGVETGSAVMVIIAPAGPEGTYRIVDSIFAG